MGFFTRLREHLTHSAQDLDAVELSSHVERVGAEQIGGLQDRCLAECVGVVRTLAIPPREKVPALVAELYDGTGALDLVWLGRREILGIVPGVRLRVRGRVMTKRGRLTMFNPRYDIVPRDADRAS